MDEYEVRDEEVPSAADDAEVAKVVGGHRHGPTPGVAAPAHVDAADPAVGYPAPVDPNTTGVHVTVPVNAEPAGFPGKTAVTTVASPNSVPNQAAILPEGTRISEPEVDDEGYDLYDDDIEYDPYDDIEYDEEV
jgi:hypothetical protein